MSTGNAVQAEGETNPRLALPLAAAMFVLVVDTSFMNVSISAAYVETDVEIKSNTQLQHQISSEHQSIQSAVVVINTDARNRSLGFAAVRPGPREPGSGTVQTLPQTPPLSSTGHGIVPVRSTYFL